MIVNVPHTCPVQVLVDTETGEVTRVVVIDEAIKHDPDGYWDIYEGPKGAELTDELKAHAVKLVDDGDVTWPSWTFGW